MDIEKVSQARGPKPSEKKERTSTPDSEEFREMMKTGKVSETEFEKPKKRQKNQEKEKLSAQTPQGPAPQESKLPSPYEGYAQRAPGVREYEEPSEPQTEQKKEEDKKTEKEKKKEQEELALYQKGKLKQAPKAAKEEAKVQAPKVQAPSEKKATTPSEKQIKPTEEAKKTKEKETEKPQIQQSTVLQEMPPNIAAQTQAITAPLTPYLHPDIIPLFEKMVGTIVQLQAKGITTTEVMLNSPAFQSSVFYGSSIIVQKYSTAPAFNIFLRGPTQAVNMFSENLDGLFDAFKKANINIGRLEAQHEKFTFRRKEKPSGEKDTGK